MKTAFFQKHTKCVSSLDAAAADKTQVTQVESLACIRPLHLSLYILQLHRILGMNAGFAKWRKMIVF